MTNNEKNKLWYQQNRDKKIASVKAYYKENKESLNAARRDRMQSDPILHEAYLEKLKQYRVNWQVAVGAILLHYGCPNKTCLCVPHKHGSVELDFHHLDGSQKDCPVSSMQCRKKSKVAEEINKCVVLCANCHRRLHAGLITVDESMLCTVDKDLQIVSSPGV